MLRMANSAAAAILIIGLVVVLFLFSSQIIGFVSGFITGIEEFIQRLMGQFTDTGDINGYTWIGYTVFFVDGTSKDIRQDGPPSMSLFPLSIAFENKDIAYFRVDVKAQLTGENLGSWESETTLQMEVYKKPETVPKTSSTGHYEKQGSAWSSGAVNTLASVTVQAATLEEVVATYGGGSWLLQWIGTVDLSVTANGALVELSSASPAGGMDFTYDTNEPNPSGLSITGGAFPLTG